MILHILFTKKYYNDFLLVLHTVVITTPLELTLPRILRSITVDDHMLMVCGLGDFSACKRALLQYFLGLKEKDRQRVHQHLSNSS